MVFKQQQHPLHQGLQKNNSTRVIPYSFIRAKHGYEMSFDKPLKNYPSGDAIKDASKTNQILEKQILKNPEQYLWVHRRFKTRPDGEEKLLLGKLKLIY